MRFRLPMILLVGAFVVLDCALLSLFAPGNDWAPLWAAGHVAWTDPSRAYDFAYVTAQQQPLVGHLGERPFVYPPTALLLFAPFALLQFQLSMAVFVAASLFLLGWAASRLGSKPILLFLAPPVVLAALAGQPTLAVVGLALAALLDLDEHERRAGVLLGIAAVLKPPLLILAPIALAGGRHWRSLEAAGATAAGGVAVSAALFGLDPWLHWIAALPKFQSLVATFEPLLRNTVTPNATALRLGLAGGWTLLACALVAIPISAFAFARSKEVAPRLVILIGGALLVSPYGMDYELAALAPAVAAMRIRKATDLLVPGAWAASLFANAGVIGLIAVYCWAVWRLFLRSSADDRLVQRRVDIAA